MPHYPSEIEYS